MLSRSDRVKKRCFDIFFSFVGIIATWWLLVIAWFVASIETKSNGLFVQKRVGRGGRLFSVYKIKTMKKVEGIETTVTAANDQRITNSGAFFRKTKIDELPQLINVLKGDMSFVGPRPDVGGYADKLDGENRIILSVRPGITGPASLKYRDEESILAEQSDPKSYNDEVIWPDKVKINKEYVRKWSLHNDIKYIIETIKGQA